MSSDEDAETGRVHEIQAAKIDDDELDVRSGQLIELGFELGPRGEIELSADRHHSGRTISADFYLELILHGDNEPTDLRRTVLWSVVPNVRFGSGGTRKPYP